MNAPYTAAFLIAFLSLASCAAAQLSISLPLRGYYRIGKYMPVRVPGASEPFTVSADGAAPVTGFGFTNMVPLLVLDRLANVRARRFGESAAFDGPLVELGDDDRLVACPANLLDASRKLFPGKNIVPVEVTLTEMIANPMGLWESVDGVMIDNGDPSARQLSNASIVGDILAHGTTIAVRSSRQPDASWPWTRAGDYWMLRHDVAGPRTSLVNESIDAPTLGWRPGASEVLRRRVILAAVAMSIVLLAISLRRRPAAGVMIVVGAVVAAIVIQWWRASLPVMRQVRGTIAVIDGPLIQYDTWLYITSPIETEAGLPAVRPVFTSLRQQRDLEMRLESRNGVVVGSVCRLRAGRCIAGLERLVARAPNSFPNPSPTVSPMESVARELYMRPGDRIVGTFARPYDDWPMVVVERAAGR